MDRKQLIRTTLGILLAALSGGGCAVGPTMPSRHLTHDRAWSAEYAARSNEADWQGRFGGPSADTALQAYVGRVGARVAAGSGAGRRIDFVVLRGWSPNAFVLGGDQVCITRGLLYKVASEGELAAALAHEIGHIASGHTANKSRQGDEYEADGLALRYLGGAGYAPLSMVSLLEKLERDFDGGQEGPTRGVTSEHPRTRDRIRRLQLIVGDGGEHGRGRADLDGGACFRTMHALLASQWRLRR